jgi:hypothetical protein
MITFPSVRCFFGFKLMSGRESPSVFTLRADLSKTSCAAVQSTDSTVARKLSSFERMNAA